MTDLQHQRITAIEQRVTAIEWFLRILVAIGVPAVVFLVLRWAGQAEFALEGAIVSACGLITVVILSPILRARRKKSG
jgi:hypothetical protein